MRNPYNFLPHFMSPVTGRILSIPDYVLIGGDDTVARPDPIIIDLSLDLINMRTDINKMLQASVILNFPSSEFQVGQVLSELDNGFLYNTGGVLSSHEIVLEDFDLTYKYLVIGNSDNKVSEVRRINYDNIAISQKKLLTGDSSGNAQEVQLIDIDNLPSLQALEIEGIGAYQVWVGTNSGRPEPSYGISIELAALTAKLEIGAFIMRNGLIVSYPNAQFLTNLSDGIVKKVSGGALANAEINVDYLSPDLPDGELFIGKSGKATATKQIDKSNMFDIDSDHLIIGGPSKEVVLTKTIKTTNIALSKNYLIRGNADGVGEQVIRLDFQQAPALKNGYIYLGSGSEGTVVESDILTKAKFVIMNDTKPDDLPASVIIGQLENNLLAKEGEAIINAKLSKGYLFVGGDGDKVTQSKNISMDALPDLTKGKIFLGNDSNRPVESSALDNKFLVFDATPTNLPNAVSLSSVTDDFIAKSGDTIINATITKGRLISGADDNKIIEIEKIDFSNFPDGTEDNLITFNSSKRPIQILTIKDKNMMPLPNGKIYFGTESTVPTTKGLQEKYLFTGDSGGNVSEVLRLDIENYVNLSKNHIHVGNDSNRPVETKLSDVAAPVDAKYILQTANSSLSSAQALDMLGGVDPRILKATSSGVIQVAIKDTDYASKETLEELRDETKGYRDEAQTFKNEAQTAKTGAETAKTAAEAAKVEAQTQAGLAQGHALNAQTQALASQTSATASAASASAAAGSATAAAGSAATAAGSAAAAAGSASSAANSSFTAGVSAAAAAGSAGAAGLSAAAAAGNAEEAGDYRDEAEEFKNNAAYSAGQSEIFSLLSESYKNDSLTYSINSANSASASAVSATASEAALAAFLATNIILTGDVSGSGLPTAPISTTFTPNPSFSGTSHLKLPTGTTAERPASPVVGMIRFNSTTSKLELYK